MIIVPPSLWIGLLSLVRPFVRLDGSTGVSKRQKLVDAFNEPGPQSFAFLLSRYVLSPSLSLPPSLSLSLSLSHTHAHTHTHAQLYSSGSASQWP